MFTSAVVIYQVTKLQSDISPLHHSLSMLSEKNSSLQADKRILEDDLKRAKAKIQVIAVGVEGGQEMYMRAFVLHIL